VTNVNYLCPNSIDSADEFLAAVDKAFLNEKQLGAFFKTTDSLLSVTEPTGYFVLLSDSWERQLGWTKEELKGKPFIELCI